LANNRLFLKCRCGETYFLAKHSMNGWWTHPRRGENMDEVPMGEDFASWLERHEEDFFPDGPLSGDATWDHQFTVEYEQ
jgi:hypothetical protein